jgi:hypothetical protein
MIHGFEHDEASTVKLYGQAPSLTLIVNAVAEGTGNITFVPEAKVPVATTFDDGSSIE